MKLHLTSLRDTEKFGRALGASALPGDVICLAGDLGAGKTTIAQAIARGLAVPDNCYVTSPSFAILHEYPGRLAMYHMDFYRLQDASEVIDLGFEEYFYRQGLTVIEWPLRAEQVLPAEKLVLQFAVADNTSRIVTITCDGPNWSARLQGVLEQTGLSGKAGR